MAKDKGRDELRDLNLDDEYFLKELGCFIKKMRIAAGFPTIRSFVDTFDISYSQYQGYEAGRNITIKILKRILLKFNLKVEDWLSVDLFKEENHSDKLVEGMNTARVSYVMSQVKLIENHNEPNRINTKIIERYIDILINCHIPRSRSFILTKVLGMDDSHNTFKRVAGKLIEYGWLDYVDKVSKRSPEQGYFTTLAGKKVLRLRG